jgi:FAD/FMN-containing dehydrogenase
MLITHPPGIDPSALRNRIEGRVSAPGDPDWDEARQAWNLAVDQRPAAVAVPTTADDVVAIVGFARERGLLVTAQGTGHNAGAYDTLANTILVKTHELRGVDIDVDERIARCAAGTLWIEVTQPASEHGLAPLAGSSPDVGVVGYVLGGGLSWLARKHGLAANHVRAIELVTAGGEIVRATHDDHPELFWALRGGGGNYGIVTAVELELYEYATVYAGMLMWPWDRAAEILKAWVAWSRTAPEEFSTSARMLQIPPLPDIPEFLAGKAFVAIDGAYAGADEQGAEALAPLRALGPEMDSFGPMAPGGLSYVHMDPEGPTPGIGGHTLLGELDDAAIDALVAIAGPGSGSPLLGAELRHLGGALARSGALHGAVDVMPGEYALFAVGVPMTPAVGAAIHAHLPKLMEAMAPWDAGTAYLNFAEEKGVDPARFYSAENYARLRRVKADVDPGGLFRGNHAISAA